MTTKTKDSFELIAHSSIAPSPDNPRRTFGEADLAELADSIRRVGVLEPILVRATPVKPLTRRFGQRNGR